MTVTKRIPVGTFLSLFQATYKAIQTDASAAATEALSIYESLEKGTLLVGKKTKPGPDIPRTGPVEGSQGRAPLPNQKTVIEVQIFAGLAPNGVNVEIREIDGPQAPVV